MINSIECTKCTCNLERQLCDSWRMKDNISRVNDTDPPKMGINFESVRIEDERMIMSTTARISKVLERKQPIFNN